MLMFWKKKFAKIDWSLWKWLKVIGQYFRIFFLARWGRGHLYFKLDIILVKGVSKHTLNTYFLCMEIDLKYAVLHAFFLISLCPFQNLSICPKTHTVFQFCTFLHPTNIHCLVLKNNSNFFFFFIFLRGWHPTSNKIPPGFLAKFLSC